jgi:hypothetical protein
LFRPQIRLIKALRVSYAEMLTTKVGAIIGRLVM